MGNPFTLSFGRKPSEYISRIVQKEAVISSFTEEPPVSNIYILTGVRGSGKTVMLTDLSDTMEREGWDVIHLNPTTDMLKALTSKLYSLPEMSGLLVKAKIDISFLGIGVSIENARPVTDYETAIGEMLALLRENGKKILVTVDEADDSLFVKQFVSAFQIFIREDLPVFLLMTGLYENISDLQNDKAITFLYRAPKIEMEPLNMNMIKRSYQKILGVDSEMAKQMAALTKGYPFAYQVLGYLCYLNDNDLEAVMPEYDQYLQEFVYEKIWSELSMRDREVLIKMSETGESKVKELRDALSMSSSEFSVYRDRLKKKGLIDAREHGYVFMSLPRFRDFVQESFQG